MAFQYFKNKGQSRPLFISLENSYHGETLGALAVSDTGLYKEVYEDILIKSLHAKTPSLHCEEEALEDMRKLLEKK